MRQENSSVSVRIIDSKPSGIQVLLLNNDKQKGYIRPREISWERRISTPVTLPEKGTVLQAVILNEEVHDELVFLSLRRLTDPWKEAQDGQKYRVGQIVEGEVVNVRNSGVFVQLEPGIDAQILPKDTPILRGQTIEDVLWLGDKVSATILSIDKEKRHIHLSLIRRLQKIPIDLKERQFQMLDSFGADDHLRKIEDSDAKAVVSKSNSSGQYIQPIIRRLQRVLIIDDESEGLSIIGGEIEKGYNASVEWATSGEEGFTKVFNQLPYDLILIDLNLKQENGVELARKIRQHNNTPIVIMSLAEFTGDGWFTIEDEFPFSHKSTEALLERIDELRHGYWQESRMLMTPNGKQNFVYQLGMHAFASQEPQQIFSGILGRLLDQTQVSRCLLLELDRSLQSISILNAYPVLSEEDLRIAQDGLYYSPARQVIEEEREFMINDVDFENDPRFKNFLINLDFQSCLGLPIQFPDRSTHYGLFLLSEEPDGFYKGDLNTEERLLYARTACSILTVAIERLGMIDYMRRYEERYTLGQLLGDMVHEINNKLSALDSSLSRLSKLNTSRPPLQESNRVQGWLDGIDAEIQSISRLQNGLKELVKSYSRQSLNEYDHVDVNQVVEEVARQLARRSRQMGVTISLDLADDLPPSPAIRSHLQQIILNLALNAVQMMSDHQDRMKIIGEQSRNYLPALEKGVLILQTRYEPANQLLPIEVRILDNGPRFIYQPKLDRKNGRQVGSL